MRASRAHQLLAPHPTCATPTHNAVSTSTRVVAAERLEVAPAVDDIADLSSLLDLLPEDRATLLLSHFLPQLERFAPPPPSMYS